MLTTQQGIARACREAHVDPADLLCCLMEGLEYRHRTYRQTFGPGMGPDAGLFVEVSDLMEMAGPDEPTPASLLAAVELQMRVRARLEPDNTPLRVVQTLVKGCLSRADGRFCDSHRTLTE
jgi:hypothetical protein